MASFGEVPHFHVNATGDVVCDTEGAGSAVMVGIMIGLISSIGINLGQNIQAIGMQEPGAQEKPCTSKTWIIGLVVFVTGSLGNMVAMAFASASILVPLESSQFVTNIFFSKLYLKKEITQKQWTGTSLAVLGTVFTCVFGPNDDRCFNLPQLKGFYANPIWVLYCLATFSAAAFGWVTYWRINAAKKAHDQDPRANPLPEGSEVSLPVLFALSSALIGGAQMIVHSKTVAELFDLMGGGEITFVDLLSDWFFWLELMITAVCGIFWAVQMNRSLGLYDPLFIIPLLQSSYITFGATASGIFYQEFRTLHEIGVAGPATWFFFICGMTMIVVGIMLLAPSEAPICRCLLTRRESKPVIVTHTGTRTTNDGLGVGVSTPTATDPRAPGGISLSEIDLGVVHRPNGANGGANGNGTNGSDLRAIGEASRSRRLRSKALRQWNSVRVAVRTRGEYLANGSYLANGASPSSNPKLRHVKLQEHPTPSTRVEGSSSFDEARTSFDEGEAGIPV